MKFTHAVILACVCHVLYHLLSSVRYSDSIFEIRPLQYYLLGSTFIFILILYVFRSKEKS